jgi:7-carboxy-7-deazaguanine synthase
MENELQISEIFGSIQGEGRFVGTPMLFIRTSGCTRACGYCDTKYHTNGHAEKADDLVEQIKTSPFGFVCWTGGEPLVQWETIKKIVKETTRVFHHIETNGDLLKDEETANEIFNELSYMAISPKELEVAKRVKDIMCGKNREDYDIKVVTDLETEGVDMLPYATMLMPLSTFDEAKDKDISQKVWRYCVEHNIKFTPRAHVATWGKKTGI